MTISAMGDVMQAPQPWDPWATLSGLGNVRLDYELLMGGEDGFVEQLQSGSWRIVLDSRLTRRQMRCTLAHELVHVARGQAGASIAPWVPSVLEELEEYLVDVETATKLVPPATLTLWCLGLLSGGGAVTVDGIANHFDVEPEIVLLAMAVVSSPWVNGLGIITRAA